ncbi:hypothetical protein [Bremerella cremea]|uniref:ArnT family glycosyltransferase n=1 Tax=Bremerella cremea TaxID=1031537 RepID=UPI0031EABDCF
MEATDCHDVHGWTTLQRFSLAAVLAATFFFHLAMQREGHEWGGDFAQYLGHARNLATLHDYADTGYIYNPDAPVIGPRAYPPLFPMFLAPIYAGFGMDLDVFRLAILLVFLATLGISAALFARKLSPWSAIGIAAILGSSPVFWEFNHMLDSEHLFLFWWMLTMLVYQIDRGDHAKPCEHWGPAIAVGVLTYLVIGTRTVGIVLPPALLLTEVLVFRRLTRFAMVSLLTAIACYASQKLLLPMGGSGYLDQLSQITAQSLASNLYHDGISFLYIWRNGHARGIAAVSGVIFSLVAVVGYLRDTLPRPQLLGVATLLYMILIVVWPGANGIRMVLPMLPAFLFWIFFAIEWLIPRPHWQRIAVAALVIYTLACDARHYKYEDYNAFPGPESVAAKEMFDHVKLTVDPDEACLFFKPRVMAFYARRRTVGFPIVLSLESLRRTLDLGDVRVAVTTNQDQESVAPLLEQEGFAIDWHNDEFQLWRRKPTN